MSFISRRTFLIAGATTLTLSGCRSVEGIVLPDITLPAIDGLRTWNGWPLPGVRSQTFRESTFTLLNVWATWCPYCRGEHGQLMKMAQENRFKIAGLVTRDTPDKVRAYLEAEGNPYIAVSIDTRRELLKPLRASGVPQTYLIDRTGTVLASISGAMSDESVKRIFEPAIDKAMKKTV